MTDAPGPTPMSAILAGQSAEKAGAEFNAAGHGPLEKPAGSMRSRGGFNSWNLAGTFNFLLAPLARRRGRRAAKADELNVC